MKIAIHTEHIRLQQLLKLAGLVGQGADVKFLLEEGQIFVNGEMATQRGKKIRPGDVVLLSGEEPVEVMAAPAE